MKVKELGHGSVSLQLGQVVVKFPESLNQTNS